MTINLNRKHNVILLLACSAVLGVVPIQQTVARPLDPAIANNVLVGTVSDPPSNVRVTPNGQILCKIKTRRRITIWNDAVGGDAWYATNACGSLGVGYIHQSQVNRIHSVD
jgi:serine/threonine-protein kinase